MSAELHASMTDPSSLSRTTVTSDASGEWPPEPRVVRSVLAGTLAGTLADRVRARMGTDGEVVLEETTMYGGYSVWTQENETEFTVSCGGREVAFHPDASVADWREDVAGGYDSVFARFDAWLSVAERPLELFDEWFAFDSEAGRFVRYTTRPGTVLARVMARRFFNFDHANLDGTGDAYGRMWQLDAVAKADESGFAAILDQLPIAYAQGLTVSEGVAHEVLFELTDDVMPGRAHL